MTSARVQIWSDIACPWCYVGKRRFEAAVARLERPEPVDVRWRSFELRPDAPRVEPPFGSYAERLALKYATTVEHGEQMVRAMTEAAANEGLEFRFDRIRPGNTFDAHRLLHFARSRGAPDPEERLMRAYMTEGRAIGEPEVLVELALELGLAEDATRSMLASDAYAEAVRADEAEAHARGVRGVPAFLFLRADGAGGPPQLLSGAQPPELLLRAMGLASGGWDGGASGRVLRSVE